MKNLKYAHEVGICPPHKVVRSRSNKEIFRCIHPRCTYTQKREFLEDKEVLCSICSKPYIVNREQLRNAKPRCVYCQNTKEGRAVREAMKKVALLVPEAEPEPLTLALIEAFAQEEPLLLEEEIKNLLKEEENDPA